MADVAKEEAPTQVVSSDSEAELNPEDLIPLEKMRTMSEFGIPSTPALERMDMDKFLRAIFAAPLFPAGDKTEELYSKTLSSLEASGVLTVSALKKFINGDKWHDFHIGEFVKQEIETALKPYTDKPEDFFTNRRNLKIFTRKWLPEDTARALVFVVHGAGEHCGRYDWLAKQLSSKGLAVFSLDHQGHGKSEGIRYHIDSFDHYVQDLLQYVDIVAAKFPNHPVFLLGHSMGGTIAIKAAQERQKYWRGVYLSAPFVLPHPRIAKPATIFIGKMLAKASPKSRIPQSKFDPKKVVRDPDMAKQYDTDPLVNHGSLRSKWAYELLMASKAIVQDLPKIEYPFLVCTGTQDLIVNWEGSKLFYEKSASKDKSYKSYEGLYHEILNEPEREKVVQDLIEWLEKHL